MKIPTHVKRFVKELKSSQDGLRGRIGKHAFGELKKEWDQVWIEGTSVHPVPTLPTLSEVANQLSTEPTEVARRPEEPSDPILRTYVTSIAAHEQTNFYAKQYEIIDVYKNCQHVYDVMFGNVFTNVYCE